MAVMQTGHFLGTALAIKHINLRGAVLGRDRRPDLRSGFRSRDEWPTAGTLSGGWQKMPIVARGLSDIRGCRGAVSSSHQQRTDQACFLTESKWLRRSHTRPNLCRLPSTTLPQASSNSPTMDWSESSIFSVG
jgi:hypothetical protein